MTRWPVVCLLVAACRPPAAPAEPTGPVAPETGRFILAHTNDLHTHFRANPAAWLPGAPDIGGFDLIDAHLGALRARLGEDAVLYVDGGDLLTGTPLMEYQEHGAWGGAMVDFLDAAQADAWVLGNHELDRGWSNAAALVRASPMPVLSANVRSARDRDAPGLPGMQRHVVLEANGVRVGVFGLTTPGLERLASAETMSRLDVLPLSGVAAAEVDALEPRVDIVVALTHTGIEADRALAAEVAGIDLIVGGHSHTAIPAPERVGDTWIVQTGAYARQLGVLDIRVEDGRIGSLDGELVDLLPDASPGPTTARTRALVERWSTALRSRFNTPIGTAAAGLDRSGDAETPLGRWAGDMLRAATGADVGIYNRGGLRADIPAGTLTLGDLYNVFPFRNEVVVFEATGEELIGMSVRALHLLMKRQYQPLEFGGLTLAWQLRMGAPEVVSLRIGDAPVDPRRTYTVATNSYVAEQWKHHLAFEPRGLQSTGRVVLEVAEDAVRAGPVVAPAEPRIVLIGAR
ncbi:MAG: bifunctional UDP-sugar hydrolase/5'-nucleotidase [Myxococcota bacterium]|nr:bifunctional UDP-sugar hydrolase/5'-nucleotidase [Myxococcota bacterium]